MSEYFDKIGEPLPKVREVYNLIKSINKNMRTVIDKMDPWQTHTYLNTSREFEKILNASAMQDSESFKR